MSKPTPSAIDPNNPNRQFFNLLASFVPYHIGFLVLAAVVRVYSPAPLEWLGIVTKPAWEPVLSVIPSIVLGTEFRTDQNFCHLLAMEATLLGFWLALLTSYWICRAFLPNPCGLIEFWASQNGDNVISLKTLAAVAFFFITIFVVSMVIWALYGLYPPVGPDKHQMAFGQLAMLSNFIIIAPSAWLAACTFVTSFLAYLIRAGYRWLRNTD